MLRSESQPCDVMDSKHKSLCSPFPCTAANGSREPKQPSSSHETVARPKPPVKPKPCVLPKPAVPVKPAPAQRSALSEVPSAEKINLLAGPKPYSSGAGNAVKRLSFGLRCPPREATNGKETSSLSSTAAKPSGGSEGTGPAKKSSVMEGTSGEECGESSNIRKGIIPFKVKPVPVAAKPERFPGTTVEEILAKIEKPNKEGVNSPDRPRLVRSFFSLDGGTAVHLGPKGYTAFRRCSSGGEGGETELEGATYKSSHEVEDSRLARTKEDATHSNGQHIPESEQLTRTPERDLNFLSKDSSSGQRNVSCDGGQPGPSSPQSLPGASFPQLYQPLSEIPSGIAPGSPDAPAQPVQPPGSPYHSADVPSTKVQLPPGSPDAPSEPLRSPVQISLDHAQAPGSPVALADHWPPGSPSTSLKSFLGHTPGLASPSARCSEVSPLPEPSSIVTPASPTEHSLERPSCLLGVFESPGSPSTLSEYCLGSDQPPGSPSRIQDPLLIRGQDPNKNHLQTLLSEDKGPQHSQLVLRRASEGVVQPQSKGMIGQELGGSLAVLSKGGGRPLEQTTGGDSNWSLSQSFEWSFPNRSYDWGGRRLGSPPRSPIKEAEDTGSLEAELDRESPSLKGNEERDSDGLERRGDETEPNGKSPFLEESNNSLRCAKEEAEEQPESPSAMGMPAPGGPSAQVEPTNLKLKGFSESSSEEDHDGLLPLAPVHKVGALGAMEPLPSLEQTAPPAQPCILFLKDAQVKTEVSCQEDDSALGLAQEGKTGDSVSLRAVEPDPGSHWLDELLASPPPSADDAKRRSTPKSEDPTGPENLLGWSRKDLSSEFGIVEASQSETFGMDWSDARKVEWPVETEQDREFGTGKRDWLSSYGIDDTNKQDMQFGTSQQDWTRGTPLLSSSNAGQEDWLTAYGSSCAAQQIGELDWSSGYGIDTAESQDREPYVRKPGWPRLCNAVTADEENSEFASKKTDWSNQYPVDPAEKTDWTSKYSDENANCPESEITTKMSDESGKYSTVSHQDTQLSASHSEEPDDCTVEITSHDTAFSARQSGWPSESDADSSDNKVSTGFSVQNVEQSSDYNTKLMESQVSTKQQTRPNTYGFGDVGGQESELSIKQPDWPSKYDLGVTHCQDGEFNTEKPDETSEHYDSQIDWESELGIGSRHSTTEYEAGNLEFCAQKPVWTDEYSLSGPHSSDFPADTRDWAKDTDVSETKRETPYGAPGNDQAGTFGPLDLPGLKVTIDLVETADSLLDQTGDLRTMAMDEPRGIGEGQPDSPQDLGLRGMDLSSDLKFGSPDACKKPTEKQPDWFPDLGLENLSASSDTTSLNPEESREPGVGQADLPYRSGIEGMNVSDLQPKGLDASEEVSPIQMVWTGKTEMEHFSYHSEATGLNADKIQHPEASEYSGESSSREFHSRRLSSPSHLLDEMIASSAVKEQPQQNRPASFHSYLLEVGKGLSSLPDDHVSSTEKTRVSPFSVEEDEKVWPSGDGGLSQLDGANGSQSLLEAKVLSHSEQNGSQDVRPISQESSITEGAEVPPVENFIFLEDTEVLDSTMIRDRANVGRKRGHRAPVTRSGGALSESDRDSWMFKDSTEPRIASAVSDEEAAEEPRSRKLQNFPLPKGVKVPLFPGLNPSALKAKLRGRNRSAEEGDTQGEAKQTSAKEAHVQRSKSCKIANVSGKPLVLPPKPEKSSGSETSSPNWLQVLKLKKKKS
ncbi:182 kDa tankyrase-1-binding protein isoform X3 [Tiliqua scincoides]|uniref:182 kDa tankyrase-1-binding protein isoform X3 n=1 Tax=Tiliqua scincoides TaxID=71010 RepID=UPI003462465E